MSTISYAGFQFPPTVIQQALSRLRASSVMQKARTIDSSDAGNDFPLSWSCSSLDFHMALRDQVALKAEGVVDGGVDGQKPLRCAGIREADPTTFSPSNRLV